MFCCEFRNLNKRDSQYSKKTQKWQRRKGSFIVFLITIGIMASHDTLPHVALTTSSYEDWESYKEKNIRELSLRTQGSYSAMSYKLQVPRHLSSLSAKMYQFLRCLVAPDKPDTKSLDEINTVLKNHPAQTVTNQGAIPLL